MKKLHQYTMILLAGVLGACSSMSVSDPYSDSFPADFNTQEYMALHPELRILQIKDVVAEYNAQVKNILGAEYNAQKAADDAAFLGKLDVLVQIYMDPYMGAGTDVEWAAFSADPSKLKTLADFNYMSIDDDLSMLRGIPVDELAISQQYLLYGKTHGWAYRVCRPEEATNTPRTELPIYALQAEGAKTPADFTPDSGMYCRDALGIDRLILQ